MTTAEQIAALRPRAARYAPIDPAERISAAPPAVTYVGPLEIIDHAELVRRNAIANARRAAQEVRP